MLPDWLIKRDVTIDDAPNYKTIEEKIAAQKGKISWGYTSYGYDVRLGYKAKIFSPINATVIDPKNFDEKILVEVDHTESQKPFTLPPHSFMLGKSIERFNIPRDLICIVLGKSTYARCGLIVNVTPGEPDWEGIWTIEISNTTPLPATIYPGEGIMQCLFSTSDGYIKLLIEILEGKFSPLTTGGAAYFREKLKEATCEISYKDKAGKYQNQVEITTPIAN